MAKQVIKMILWTEGLYSFTMLVTLIIHGQFNVITLAFDARFPLLVIKTDEKKTSSGLL